MTADSRAAAGREGVRMATLSSGRVRRAVATPWVRTVAVLTAVQIMSELAFSFVTPFTPLYLQQLGVADPTEAGVWAGAIAGISAVLGACVAPLWGIAADRFGHRLMIQRALLGSGIVILATAFAQSPEQLLVLRIAQSMLSGVVAAIATVASLTTPIPYLATVLGMLQAAMFLGVSLGPLFGGVFADLFGLRLGFLVAGAIMVVLTLLVTALVPDPRKHARAARASGVNTGDPGAAEHGTRRLMTRELFAVVSLMGVVRFVNLAPQPVLPLYVQQLLGETDHLATIVGIVLATTGVAASASALLLGRVTDRYGWRPTLLGCLACTIVLSPLHLLIGSVWHLLVLRTAMGFALGGMFPAIQALMILVTPPGRRGAAFGLLATANAFGNGGGPVVGSLVAAAFGVPIMFTSMVVVLGGAGWVLTRLQVPGAPRARPSH
jgi:DHA1 family multidrug resistance protein-like MFS transporter